jgi:hypothetical protein
MRSCVRVVADSKWVERLLRDCRTRGSLRANIVIDVVLDRCEKDGLDGLMPNLANC